VSYRRDDPPRETPSPRAHLSGPEYLAVLRRQRIEPARPYTYECSHLTGAEYEEVLLRRAGQWRPGVIPEEAP